MSIGELCSREVICIERSETVALAAGLMRDHHVGCVVVVAGGREGRRPVGMITDRDIALRIAAAGLDAAATAIGKVMTADPACIAETDGVGRAVEVMRAKGVRRLPVVDSAGVLVGLLSVDDLMDLFGEEWSAFRGMLEKGLAREQAARGERPRAHHY